MVYLAFNNPIHTSRLRSAWNCVAFDYYFYAMHNPAVLIINMSTEIIYAEFVSIKRQKNLCIRGHTSAQSH